MDGTAEDDAAGELMDLTRQLRAQLMRHATLGAWAAPGGASSRELPAEADDAAGDNEAAAPAPAGPLAASAPAAGLAASAPAAALAASAPAAGLASDASKTAAARTADLAATAVTAAAPTTAEPVGLDSAVPAHARASFADAPHAATAPHAAVASASASFAAPHAAVASMPAADAAHADDSIDPDELAAREAGQGADRAPIISLGRKTLPQIRAELGECTRCKLHSTRRSIVFGVGSADTPLMFVGEAPGEQEDRRGEPFVGPAGQLLDKMIEAMGWTRDAVYIANTTKCRPPNNRNPQPDELSQCMPFLHEQIAAIAPRIIVALGRPASNQLLGTDAPISTLRGKFHNYARTGSDGVSLKIMPTFHPAYLLRDPDKKREAWADLKLVMAELARLGIDPPNPARG